MLLKKNKKKNLENIYKSYLKVKDGVKEKWEKNFFFNLIGKDNFFFYSSRKEKGYLIFSVTFEEVDIIALATDIGYRKKGIASGLLNKLILFSKKNTVSRITLEVKKENEPAINLYKKFGFLDIGERKNYYNEGSKKIDAILMQLNL